MAKYVRLSIKGRLGSQEVWSVNPVIDPAGEVGFDFDQTNFDAFVASLRTVTIPTVLLEGLSTAGSITGFRAELRDTDAVGFIGAAETTLASPIVGTGTPTKTPQTAFVASLRTGSALASGRGRLYWPALGLTISATTLRLPSTAAGQAADGMSSYLTRICAQAKATLTPVSLVQFGVSVYSPTKKLLTPVTNIRVGDVLDVQRRRRDAMPEAYSTSPFPGAA